MKEWTQSPALFRHLLAYFGYYIEGHSPGGGALHLDHENYKSHVNEELIRFRSIGEKYETIEKLDLSSLPSPPARSSAWGKEVFDWAITLDAVVCHELNAFSDLINIVDRDEIPYPTAIMNLEFAGWQDIPGDGEARALTGGAKLLWQRAAFRHRLENIDTSTLYHHSALLTPYMWCIWRITCSGSLAMPTFHAKSILFCCPRQKGSAELFKEEFDRIIRASDMRREMVKDLTVLKTKKMDEKRSGWSRQI